MAEDTPNSRLKSEKREMGSLVGMLEGFIDDW